LAGKAALPLAVLVAVFVVVLFVVLFVTLAAFVATLPVGAVPPRAARACNPKGGEQQPGHQT